MVEVDCAKSSAYITGHFHFSQMLRRLNRRFNAEKSVQNLRFNLRQICVNNRRPVVWVRHQIWFLILF